MMTVYYSPRYVGYMMSYSWMIREHHLYVACVIDDRGINTDWIGGWAQLMRAADVAMRKRSITRPPNRKQLYQKIVQNHKQQVKLSKLKKAIEASIISGLPTIDGISIVVGNRVLVKNQIVACQDGITEASIISGLDSLDQKQIINRDFPMIPEIRTEA